MTVFLLFVGWIDGREKQTAAGALGIGWTKTTANNEESWDSARGGSGAGTKDSSPYKGNEQVKHFFIRMHLKDASFYHAIAANHVGVLVKRGLAYLT